MSIFAFHFIHTRNKTYLFQNARREINPHYYLGQVRGPELSGGSINADTHHSVVRHVLRARSRRNLNRLSRALTF
jgi:hypothetical protein